MFPFFVLEMRFSFVLFVFLQKVLNIIFGAKLFFAAFYAAGLFDMNFFGVAC